VAVLFQAGWHLAQAQTQARDPVAVFLIIVAVMLVMPLLFERLKLPGIIGLILAGVAIGPHGFALLQRDRTMILLGTVGVIFLMFLGGLETSLDDLKRNADKAIIFGLATFLLPMGLGTAAMVAIGYDWLPAILIASCFASHTLLALPVLSKLGIMKSPTVTATLGGTLITNVLALLVLAVVVKANQGDLTLAFWLRLIPSLAIFTFATLWGVPRLGRWFFRRFGHDEGAEFTFVLAALFVVSYLAGRIEVEPIVGAFLAGVAITPLIPQYSPLMNRIQFIGNTLFVPFFLISVGMLVDPKVLLGNPRSLLVAAVMIAAEFLSKLVAALGTARYFRWKFPNALVMFGLSVAQAASTLAAITVAYNIQLVDEVTINGIIAMILVSCVASPWITARWGERVDLSNAAAPPSQPLELTSRVMVPVANPSTEDNLLQLAIILTKQSQGTLLPLHVLLAREGRASEGDRTRQTQLLGKAKEVAHASVAQVETIGRLDGAIDLVIIRAAQDHEASLVICGWKGYSTYQENFFGSVIDNVVRQADVPVLITRFAQPLKTTRRIVLAIAERQLADDALKQVVELAKTLATELKAKLTVLWLRRSPVDQPVQSFPANALSPEIPIKEHMGSLVRRVSEQLSPDDLVIVVANTHRIGQPAIGREPEAIARLHPQNSIIIIHYP
jgi:Kef-type K+ transport system membrane component KefB/nucleotide-binding universal stress UspA family protein